MSLFNQIASLLGGEKINQFKTVLEWVETQGELKAWLNSLIAQD